MVLKNLQHCGNNRQLLRTHTSLASQCSSRYYLNYAETCVIVQIRQLQGNMKAIIITQGRCEVKVGITGSTPLMYFLPPLLHAPVSAWRMGGSESFSVIPICSVPGAYFHIWRIEPQKMLPTSRMT